VVKFAMLLFIKKKKKKKKKKRNCNAVGEVCLYNVDNLEREEYRTFEGVECPWLAIKYSFLRSLYNF